MERIQTLCVLSGLICLVMALLTGKKLLRAML